MLYPQDVEGQRRELRPDYNRAGALESVTLNGAFFVERIAYNAKGQRVLIAYGNGVMTRYAYDPKTFRLARLRTERYVKPNPLTYQPTGAALQDFAYEYDLVGNITQIRDRTRESGIPNQCWERRARPRVHLRPTLSAALGYVGASATVRPTCRGTAHRAAWILLGPAPITSATNTIRWETSTQLATSDQRRRVHARFHPGGWEQPAGDSESRHDHFCLSLRPERQLDAGEHSAPLRVGSQRPDAGLSHSDGQCRALGSCALSL